MHQQIEIVVHHRSDLPAGVPAIWMDDPTASPVLRRVILYLRNDLPQDLGDKFRSLCIRHSIPDADWDNFVVASTAPHLAAVM